MKLSPKAVRFVIAALEYYQKHHDEQLGAPLRSLGHVSRPPVVGGRLGSPARPCRDGGERGATSSYSGARRRVGFQAKSDSYPWKMNPFLLEWRRLAKTFVLRCSWTIMVF